MNLFQTLNPSYSFDDEAVPEQQTILRNILVAALNYIPLMLGFNAFGFVLIYFLALFGLLDSADLKLLGVGAISLITALLHIPIAERFRKNEITNVILMLIALDGTASALQMFFWEGIAPLAFFMSTAISPVLVFIFVPGIRRNVKLTIVAFGVMLALLTYGLGTGLRYERLQTENLSTMAALTVYITVIIVMVTLVVTSAIPFRTIAARLIITFTFITLVSATSTLVVSALVNLFRDRTQTFEQLQVISKLKTDQMLAVLQDFERNATQVIAGDPQAKQRILYLLERNPNNFAYQLNYDLVASLIRSSAARSAEYQEIYLFDDTGRILISSDRANENRVISGSQIFLAAARGQKYVIINSPFASQQAIVILTRIDRNGEYRGTLATRIRSETIRNIFEQPSLLGETLEIYLVGDDFTAITSTRAGQNTLIETQASRNAFTRRILSGTGIYPNYENINVLGFYQYLPELNIMAVAEIAQREVASKILTLLFTNISVGIFTALLTLSIVLVISRSISNPIITLAQKATLLAQGDLSARVNIRQADEIGILGQTFNSLGNELQTLIQTLEHKVADRTEDLQKQASRLRLAAEVARDATTSRDLDELLNRSAQLVMDRFGFYHTGVFLIDPQREFAVLRASPTEAGQEMIRRQHRLRIGQVGIVGYVAATGEPRIALDTGQDVVYFNNPLLPNTRSELALPLMVNDQVIGVLDVQSEQPEAFNQEDIATLRIMADQLALAIQRTQVSDELKRNLQELEYAYQRFTLTSWRELAEASEQRIGYAYDGAQITPVKEIPEESQQAIRQGKPTQKSRKSEEVSSGRTTLAIPVKVREQVIGAINLEFANENLPQDTVILVEEISSRLAMSLENARLYSETQKLAENERLAGEIANRIGSSINVETILRTAVQEIGRLAPGAEIMVEITKNKDA
jgi:GAF domain-containing protein/HAMP domain-containing protein